LNITEVTRFMAKRHDDHGIGIPRHEIEALARVLLPTIQAYFKSEDGQREFAEWKERQEANENDHTGAGAA
jgi:hypothetical protein